MKKILNKKTEEMSKVMQYEAIANYDPDAKELLERYKSLKNNNTVALPIADECDEDDYIPF